MSVEQQEGSIDENDKNEFRELVREYVLLPEQIKKDEEPVKQSKARVKECERDILHFMKTKDIPQCVLSDEIGGGVLVEKKSTTKSSIKKENWVKGIETFFKKRGIDATFEDVEKEVDATRELTTSSALKRIKK